ncbi:unnamed protein product [Candidula unifasciata]|uniref:Major facilitator superfamily (MFS) profile domain-containing protein n=1 Tax=Candidula unifasciata TaxID=100452 RepID=A0A8S3YZ16_9EUPU|nr:unnamed protein product [Candidula unifasciata]
MMFGKYNPGWSCQGDTWFNLTENNHHTIQQDGTNVSEFTSRLCSCGEMKTSRNWTFNNAASTIITEWNLICDDSWKSSLIVSVQMTGVLFGAYAGGQIGDTFGRKFSIHGSCALMVIANLVAIFSVSWQMYAAIMFFIGLFVGCILPSCYVYNFEFLPSWWRGFITLPIWSLSTCLFALCVMALKNWRHLHVAIAFIALLAFLPVFWLPESMRFLAVHGHLKKANKVVKRISRLNKTPLPDTSIMETIAKIESRSLKAGASYTYLHLFHINVRKYTLVLGYIWFVLALSQYMIGFGLSALSGDFFVNMLLFFALPFPVRLIAAFLVTKFGRKLTASVLLLLSSIFSFVIVVIQLVALQEGKGLPTTVLAIGINMLTEGAWGTTVIFGNELFPTDIRTLSYGFCSSAARLAAIIAPHLIPKHSLPMYAAFIIQGLLQLTSFAAYLTLPESKGKPLQENLIRQDVTTEQHMTSTNI